MQHWFRNVSKSFWSLHGMAVSHPESSLDAAM
jgi:hypothetical protein